MANYTVFVTKTEDLGSMRTEERRSYDFNDVRNARSSFKTWGVVADTWVLADPEHRTADVTLWENDGDALIGYVTF